MTAEEVETAIRAEAVGWDSASQGLVDDSQETPGYCNRGYCAALAARATASGWVTAADIGEAARALVDGDDTLMRTVLE